MLPAARTFGGAVQQASKSNQRVLAALRRPASASTKQQVKQRTQGVQESLAGKTLESAEKPATRTVAQLDEEMRRAMEGLAGDGGESGVELEDGKAVGMKRAVRENMFRYI